MPSDRHPGVPSDAPVIRRLTRDDADAYEQAKRYAFLPYPQPRNPNDASGDRDVVTNTDYAYGAFVDGELKSMITLLPFEQAIRGTWKTMTGVSAVATYPEARGRGFVRRIFEHWFSELANDSTSRPAVSMLIPFRSGFYAKFGYVTTDRSHVVTVEPRSLFTGPSGRRGFRSAVAGTDYHYKRLPVEEAQEHYTETLKGFSDLHGTALPRPGMPEDWAYRTKGWAYLTVNRGEECCATCFIKMEAPGSTPRMKVSHIHYRDEAARLALCRYLAAHEDQAEMVELSLSYDERFYSWLDDVGRSPGEGNGARPAWQTRIIDLEKALGGLPLRRADRTASESSAQSASAPLVLTVTDRHCPWNEGSFRLIDERGSLKVERLDAPDPRGVPMPIEALTSIVYGSMGLDRLSARWGLVLPEQTAARIERWFPERAVYNDYPF